MRRASSTPKTPTIWWSDDFAAYIVDTSFSKEFVDELKFMTNHTSRWEPGKKVWLIQEPFLDTVKGLLKKNYGDFVFMPRRAQQTAPAGNAKPFEVTAASFLRMINVDELSATCRKVQARLHPDQGGDANKAAIFNALYDQVKKELS